MAAVAEEPGAVPENLTDSDAARMRGNAELKKGDYVRAIKEYNTSLKLDPENALSYSNRALAFLTWDTGKEVRALRDAEMAIKLRPDWVKGYYRKASALAHLNRFDEALVEANRAMELSNENKDVQQLHRWISSSAKRAAAQQKKG